MDAGRKRIASPLRGLQEQVLGSAANSVAVGNLVDNAIVYSDPGARVVVAAMCRPEA
jgi:two-component system sensor histidine kinase SenX3